MSVSSFIAALVMGLASTDEDDWSPPSYSKSYEPLTCVEWPYNKYWVHNNCGRDVMIYVDTIDPVKPLHSASWILPPDNMYTVYGEIVAVFACEVDGVLVRDGDRAMCWQPEKSEKVRTMRKEVELSDEEMKAVFEELGYGLTVDDLVFTRETIDDFESGRRMWKEPGAEPEHHTVKTYDAWTVRGAQAKKGDARRDVVVVDFGTVRAVRRS